MSKNFSGQNLRGKSFANQDLTGADFSYADIRGANFKQAKLVGANFSHAVAGLQNSLFNFITFIEDFIASLIWGFLPTIAIFSFNNQYDSHMRQSYLGHDETFYLLFPFIVSGLWLYIILFFGFKRLDRSYMLSVTSWITFIWIATQNDIFFKGLVLLSATMVYPIFQSSLVAEYFVIPLLIKHTYWVGDITLKSHILRYLFGNVTPSISRPLHCWLTPRHSFNLTLPTLYAFFIFVAYLAGNLATIILLDDYSTTTLISIGVMLLTIRAIKDFSEEPPFIVRVSTVAKKGTNFKKADLTDANFEEALLQNTTFENAIVTRTCWFRAKQLRLANVTDTILTDRVVRELLLTGNGRDQSFKGLNLKGAYLVGADLSQADLTEADLSEATLQEANLTGTKLTKTQALHTDFRNAIFTGASLQAWNIDYTTQLNGVICEYLYLLEHEGERRPNSGIFGENEFAKLFQEVINTVDFIFKNGIDWKAFLISFNNLRVVHENAEILVQGIENKGDGVFVVKINVPSEIDRSKFHSELKLEYENQLRLIETEYKAKLQSYEQFITVYREENTDLHETMRKLAEAQRSTIIIGELNMNNKYGGIHVDGNVDGGILNAGVMKDVTNTIQQLPDINLPGQQTSLKGLLMQLQTLIIQANDNEIPQKVKVLALEQIKMLATVGNNPNDEEHKKMAQLVLPTLKGVFAHLPTAVAAHGIISGISHVFQ